MVGIINFLTDFTIFFIYIYPWHHTSIFAHIQIKLFPASLGILHIVMYILLGHMFPTALGNPVNWYIIEY